MRRRQRRLSMVPSSTTTTMMPSLGGCLVAALVLAQAVAAVNHAGYSTPAERRHPRAQRAERKRQLDIIIGSPQDPLETLTVSPEPSSDNDQGFLAQLLGGGMSSTSMASSTFTSISSSSDPSSSTSTTIVISASVDIASSPSTSSSAINAQAGSSSSSVQGITRPPGSTPGLVSTGSSSAFSASVSSTDAPEPDFAPSLSSSSTSTTVDGGLLGSLLGTPTSTSATSSLASASVPTFGPVSSVPAFGAASPSSSSSFSIVSSSAIASSTSDAGFLGGFPGGAESSTTASSSPSAMMSSATPTSTGGGLLGDILGGETSSSSSAPPESNTPILDTPTSTAVSLLGNLSSTSSLPTFTSTADAAGAVPSGASTPGSQLVMRSSTFGSFPVTTTAPSVPTSSEPPTSVGGFSVISSEAAQPTSEGAAQPSPSDIPTSSTSSTFNLISAIFGEPSSTFQTSDALSQTIPTSVFIEPSTTSTGPINAIDTSTSVGPIGDATSSTSVDSEGINTSTLTSVGPSELETSTSSRIVSTSLVGDSDTQALSTTSGFDSVPSRSTSIDASTTSSGALASSTSSGRDQLETVSGMPNVSGSGVVQFTPSSTVSSASSTAPTSASFSADDAYTPSQTWLIVATSSAAASQATAQSTSSSAITSQTSQRAGSSSLPATATIPSSIPTMIVPANSVVNQKNVGTGTSDDPVKDDVLISILLSEQEYPWLFVVGSSDATSQLFNTFPVLISTPLNITTSEVQTYGLMVYQPASWDGRETSLLTQYLAYIPSADFDTLDAYMKNRNSALFNQDGIPGQLAAQINTAYPLAATVDGPGGSKDSTSSDGGDNGKTRKIIIGVCVGIGGMLWIGLVFWIYKRVKRSNETSVHRRLSEHMSMFGDFRRSEYGAMGATGGYTGAAAGAAAGYGAGRRVSRAPSLSPSEIDGRPSSFYASPLENDRSMRQVQGDPFADGMATGVSGYSAYTGATGTTGGGDTPTNYGPSVFGNSWFAQPGGRKDMPHPPVPGMTGGGRRSPPTMRQSQNPFEDIVTRSFLTTSGSMEGINRRAPGVSKGMISQPILQQHSLEWDEQEHRGFAA